MRTSMTLILLLITVAVFGTVHILALTFKLYFYIWWLDKPVHMLGGAAVALSVFALGDLVSSFPRRYRHFVPTITFVLMVGLAWEVFEVYAGIPIIPGYALDTATDVLADLAGGCIGWLVGYNLAKMTTI